jgi:hypothetical protein
MFSFLSLNLHFYILSLKDLEDSRKATGNTKDQLDIELKLKEELSQQIGHLTRKLDEAEAEQQQYKKVGLILIGLGMR